MKKSILFIFLCCPFVAATAQTLQPRDKAIFKVYKEGYFEKYILSGIEEFRQKETPKAAVRSFKVDMGSMDIPRSKDEFKPQWHTEPISQGNTGTCWCFSGTSFFESEIFRQTGQKLKLSEMYTVYFEYLEKAKYFVETRGHSVFAEGSQFNAIQRSWKKHGIVPAEDYTGLLEGQVYHNHEPMMAEMSAFLNSVKAANNWNEEFVMSTIREILNHYMGEPPQSVKVEGRTMTPQQYLKEVVRINPDDYVNVISIMNQDYWKMGSYEVPDNWWHSRDYYNVPLDDFMAAIKKAVKTGYTLVFAGDVSEAGFDAKDFQTAVVPTFDIPSAYIDEASRQFRFSNGSTTDDHGMHAVASVEKNGTTWFMLKDSGAGSKTGGKEKNKNFGYYFFHEDFVKLKMMAFVVHKEAVRDLLAKFK